MRNNQLLTELDMPSTLDKNGNEIKIGAIVKVVYICPDFISKLPDDESDGVASMLGEELEV